MLVVGKKLYAINVGGGIIMIETIHEEKNNSKERDIRLPKNIKQVGTCTKDTVIYIEDYAYSFLKTLYECGEQLSTGVLLGTSTIGNGKNYIFIRGVILASCEQDDFMNFEFSQTMWLDVYEEKDIYYHECEIVGWFVATGGLVKEDFERIRKIHIDNFAGKNKTFMAINRDDKDEDFYIYENNYLAKQPGFIAIYEKNDDMQEYMMKKRPKRMVEAPLADNDVVINFKNTVAEKKAEKQKHHGTLIYSAATMMVLIVTVIGINMMNSYDKMENVNGLLGQIANKISGLGDLYHNSNNRDNATSKETQKDDVVPVNKVPGNVVKQSEESQSDIAAVPETTVSETKTEEDVSSVIVRTHEYVIVKGDTLMSICRKNYGDTANIDEIMKLNNIDDPNKIYIGQVIKLP